MLHPLSRLEKLPCKAESPPELHSVGHCGPSMFQFRIYMGPGWLRQHAQPANNMNSFHVGGILQLTNASFLSAETNFPKPDAKPGFCNAELVLTTCALAPFDTAKAVWCAFHSATVGHALFCMRTGAFVPVTSALLCQPPFCGACFTST